ncbi:Holliday junction DNA helicase subunit RuvA [Mariprofundus ferrinatatus]|uniref:Holliday junction branch migration complex subunit RuvA n=1 Tax=Mariprofundus ferrinatatus TaxID=1921087 RepID=A0A2K8L4A9_9PROT|nr:Holliday junction branch migration protein RuvA [Mariprofundus ferrinatatus]ATX81942.1 Holliday junction DNA helicase subunit RuvA [Mariprofundus ferrinatatus]
MIGWLSGTVRELDPAGLVIVESGGVGYEIALSLQTLCKLKQGQKAELSIHTYVREDQITLFGFANSAERKLFRKLNTVSGIGARMALNLMSGMSTDELVNAIESSDDIAIARTPGIGKRTAQRLIIELQGKLDAGTTSGGAAISSSNEDVRSALTNLGYKPAQIDAALKKVEPADFETMFRNTLKALG